MQQFVVCVVESRSQTREKRYCYIKRLLWQIYLDENIETYLGFIYASRYFCPILTKFVVSGQIFMQVPNVKFTQVLSV